MSGVSTMCFMTSVMLAFVPVALMVVPVVAAVFVVVAVVPTVLVVRIVVSCLLRSCWGLTHTAFSSVTGGAGQEVDASLSGSDVAFGVGVEKRAAGVTAQPVTLVLVVAVESGFFGPGT